MLTVGNVGPGEIWLVIVHVNVWDALNTPSDTFAVTA